MRATLKNAIIIILLFFQTSIVFGQNKFLNLGFKNYGICFGNSSVYNGLRLNLWDKKATKINGINLSGKSEATIINGISIGVLAHLSSITNGIQIGGFGVSSTRSNGFSIAGYGLGGEKRNGIGIAGIWVNCDTLNGIFLGILAVASAYPNPPNKVINGFAAGIIGVGAEKVCGIITSLCWSYSNEQQWYFDFSI